MKVLAVLLKYPPDFTGAGRRIHNLYRRLQTKGVEEACVIATSHLKTKNQRFSEIDGVRVSRVINNSYVEAQKGWMGKLAKLSVVFRGSIAAVIAYFKIYKRVDLVHAIDSSWLSTVISWCAVWTGKPLVREIVLAGVDDPETIHRTKNFLIRNLFLKTFDHAGLIVVLSPPLKEACLKYGIPEHKIWCRPNPVYFEGAPSGSAPTVDWSIPTIFWAGKISPRKNVEFLLQAACHLEGRVQLVFAGHSEDERYMASIRRAAADVERKTNSAVTLLFIGPVENRMDLFEMYRQSSLFWFSSHQEGLPNVVLESLLAGTPVVSLPVDGIMQHVLEGQKDGEIVMMADPKLFADAVNRALKPNAPYDRADIAARARARFEPNAIEEQYVSRFKALLK